MRTRYSISSDEHPTMFDSSAYTSRGRFKRTKFTPTTVDESLFGERRTTLEPDPIPEFEPPWVDNGKTKLKSPPKPLLFYSPTSPSPNTNSLKSRATPERKYKPAKFSPSVVDNSLFESDVKKNKGHELKRETFITTLPQSNIDFDDTSSTSVYEKQDSFRTNSARSRPSTSRKGKRSGISVEKSLPPWK